MDVAHKVVRGYFIILKLIKGGTLNKFYTVPLSRYCSLLSKNLDVYKDNPNVFSTIIAS